MEHIELAGVHSGDSACVLPSLTYLRREPEHRSRITRSSIAEEMHVRGLMNMQYAIEDGKVYRTGGKSACQPYRAAGIQGLQHPDGAAGYPDRYTMELTGHPSPVPSSEGEEHPITTA